MKRKSTKRDASRKTKPSKPHPDFPLYSHASGRWAKKVRGKLHYFGKWLDDPKGKTALELWLEQKDDLLAGRQPRTKREGLSVVDLCNLFLHAKKARIATGELAEATWKQYHLTCQRLASVFGQRLALLHNSDRGRVFVWSRFASSDHLTARHPQLRHRV